MIDESHLLQAFQRLERPLYSVLFRWLWHAQDCQDLIQDAFLRVWDQRARVTAASLDALIYTTALNLARNRLRWRSLWPFAEQPIDTPLDPALGPSAQAERRQREALLKRALDQLDRDSRNLVLLSECAGLSTEELCRVLGWPPGTVASRKHRALARLRAALKSMNVQEGVDGN
ncbi:MAG: sigma-70 family RNA polymerase sigma factor [Lysobacterales bacterium]